MRIQETASSPNYDTVPMIDIPQMMDSEFYSTHGDVSTMDTPLPTFRERMPASLYFLFIIII